MNDKVYNVGIYVRLSNDDERSGESVSIENQKLLLEQYVKDRGWNLISTYCDDGYSGTNFDRPGVKRLIEDAKAKKINVILCKDLSRFGRNYIEIGQFTDYLFPSIGCGFIALNNGINTLETGSSNEVMSFLNLFNEFYSRDTSKKVKSVKKACAESGKFLGTFPPYGYKRNPQNKHHLIIDEETAPNVRRIFQMRSQGMSFRSIALTLNEDGILPPGTLYYHRKGMSEQRNVNQKWSNSTVTTIIRNEVYIGNMVQGKSGTVSYKNRKLVAKPADEWIRVENTHEPLVSKEMWDIVCDMDKKQVIKRQPKEGKSSIFSGIVYCGDCGFKMVSQSDKMKKKDGSTAVYRYFMCGNYSRSGKSACTAHIVYENVLIQLVTADIREKAQYVEYDEASLIDRIMGERNRENKSRLSFYEQDLKVQTARLRELENLMQTLYEDKVNGTIPETVFKTLMQKYEKERAEKSLYLPTLQDKIAQGKKQTDDVSIWAGIIRKYTQLEVLNETILFELVDRIEVCQSYKEGNKRICDIKVYYRYVGNIDTALVSEEQEVCHAEAI